MMKMNNNLEFVTLYKELKLNVLPCKPNSKEPAIEWKQYQNSKYEGSFQPNQNVAVICGKSSENLVVIDIDSPELMPKLFDDFESLKQTTLVVKTGSGGYHIYVRPVTEIPSTMRLTNKNGQHIDIQSDKTYVIAPPSIHPNGKRYQIVSSVTKIGSIDIGGFLESLNKLGFDTNHNWKPIHEIVKGVGKGDRNNSAFKYTCHLLDTTRLDPETTWHELERWNNTNYPPLDESELRTIYESAIKRVEHDSENSEKNNTADSRGEDGFYEAKEFDLVAKKIQNEIHFVTIRENKEIWYYDKIEGIYKPLGHTIIEELCQRYIHKCKKQTVAEVIDTIRRNKTMIYMADLLDSKHINTQNGILDPDTFELEPHSPEFLTTTKLPFSINHNARNLKLWNHILTIIDGKDINLIMELIWICISWNNPFKKMFVFKGDSNTQKSTLADILAWIIGLMNVSRQKPESFLSKGSRFGTSKFIGKRINIASEIGNLTQEMLENQKSLIGAELQNTERKNDNAERYFDPNRFVFLYTTNKLGGIYSSINDNSVITRYQFLIFRNKIEDSKANGLWYNTFFENEQDKQTAIDTIVNIVINYKKAQSLGKVPKTQWSTIAETKQILREEMPKEDKYFEDERIIRKEGPRLNLDEIKKDFESFVGYTVSPQQMGVILKKNGFTSSTSNGSTYFKDRAFNTKKDQTILTS